MPVSRVQEVLAEFFIPAVQAKGRGLYLDRAVNLRMGNAISAEATVRGTKYYETELLWERGVLQLWCECPYFDSEGPCKHLWATVLAAEARGHLTAIIKVTDVMRMDADFDDDDEELGTALAQLSQPQAQPAPPSRRSQWKSRLEDIAIPDPSSFGSSWPAKREILYVIDLQSSHVAGYPVIGLYTRDLKLNGTYSGMIQLRMERGKVQSLPSAVDREILSAILGGTQYFGASYIGTEFNPVPASVVVRHPLSRVVVPLAAQSGRCFLRKTAASDGLTPLAWDAGEPWTFDLELKPSESGSNTWLVTGSLRRGDVVIRPSAPSLITKGGIVILDGRGAELAADVRHDWLMNLRQSGDIPVPEEERDELLSTLLTMPAMPKLVVPEELKYEEVTLAPRPSVRITTSIARSGGENLNVELSFDYDGRQISSLDKTQGFFDSQNRRLIRRDLPSEDAATNVLLAAGLKLRTGGYMQTEHQWDLSPSKLIGFARAVVQNGWHLQIDGNGFLRPGASSVDVTSKVASGIDWFELKAEVQYGETSAGLPELLEAVRRGDGLVRLKDGNFGFLPDDWMRRITMLASMGEAEDGQIRFRSSQAGLLDALLASQPGATFDAGFARVRQELREFRNVEALEQPPGFVGQLRGYQQEGLGWMDFLRRFSFGGCLADDMGVGKTAQVLAMLESRRESANGPSLVVVPRSLVFNWREEAARFTPQLRVLDYTGVQRTGADLTGYDVVITTYGTLRRDAARLKDIEFDYLVLDEAQAVKNANTDSAKAVRLLRGRHRLALSGTPVENHLGELWSLFEFLNPGMLGAASVFKMTTGAARSAGRLVSEETSTLLSQALRPFILRRTKDQVAKELPAKTEQTVYCELEPQQRKLYNELRQHYRDSLLQKIDQQGMGKSKIMVLEALLRLRQAACHPGLIDIKRSSEPSAKLDALLEQLADVLDSGHKALVFSQFTSLLKIVRERLDKDKVVYEYLDGKTTDRQSCVERFQTDPACNLFLISLKAGGLGLNLTAAEYVFILDPWWNPAVEAQAVDRAHRIGQTKAVFAYRLIARDTVEEKVLELQKSKRDLAAAIIGQDNAMIRDLKREDLELLLS